jgi:hypothetical protein
MKCVKNKTDGKIIRCSNEKAQELVEKGHYVYVSKKEYKQQ